MAKKDIVAMAHCPNCGAFCDHMYAGNGMWQCLVCGHVHV